MIFPLPSHAIPLLGCSYDDIGTLHVAKIPCVAVTGQLSTLEPELIELGFPVTLALGAQSLGRRLVNHLVLTRRVGGNSATHGKLKDDSLSASRRRCKHKVVVGIKHPFETFGLYGIESRIGKHGPETIG